MADELEVLDGLEADLAAVEHAIERLDAVVAEGAEDAGRILEVVPEDRFGSELVGDGLLDEQVDPLTE